MHVLQRLIHPIHSVTMQQASVRRESKPSHGFARQRSRRLRAVARRAAAVDAPTSRAAPSESKTYDTVIVGAGISGLVTALALQTKHSDAVGSFLVTEARERVGGNITSCSNDDFVWEEGPNSCTPSDSVLEAAVRFCCRLVRIRYRCLVKAAHCVLFA